MKTLTWFALCVACCSVSSSEANEVQLCDRSLHATISTEISETNIDELYACPRCRRAVPPGPRKQPANA